MHVDELFGLDEIALREVIIDENKADAGARRDAECFFEILRCAAGEQGTGRMVKHPGTAQKLHGFIEVVDGFEPEFG